jgi:Ca-activated chloride channel homolog
MSGWLDGLWRINHLGDAWVLWLWCLIPLGVFASMSRRRGEIVVPGVSRLVAGKVGRGWAVSLRWVPGLLQVIAFGLLVFALARPQETSGEQKTSMEGVAMQVVVDRSSSMSEPIEDSASASDKITVARLAVERFVMGDGKGLKGRGGDLVGLITFARYADTLAPLSRTHAPLAEAVKGLRLAKPQSGEDGTAIGEALALAAARLKRAEEEVSRSASGGKPDFTIRSKAIVLLTDGSNNAGEVAPMDAAKLAKEWGIRIYTIGVGGQRMMTMGGLFGDQRVPVGGGADEQLLTSLAEMTNGQFFKAEDAESLTKAYAAIDQLEKSKIETTSYTNVTERYVPFAAAGLGLLCGYVLLSSLVFRRLP